MTFGLFTYISVQRKFLLCSLLLPMMKPSKNNPVTTTIHQIHRINLLSFFIVKSQRLPHTLTLQSTLAD